MIWPVFRRSLSLRGTPHLRGTEAISRMSTLVNTLNPNLNGFTIINPIPANLRKNIWLNLTDRGTIIYGREGQKIWREIVILEKQIKNSYF